MISNEYNQTVDLKVSKLQRLLQIGGILTQFLSVGFIVLAIAINYLYLIAFLALALVGISMYQIFQHSTKAYEYYLRQDRFVVHKKDMLKRSKEFLTVKFEDIENIEVFRDFIKDKEIVCTQNVSNQNCLEISFIKESKQKFLLIEPDDYMKAVIIELSNELNKGKNK